MCEIQSLKSEKENMFNQVKELNQHNQKLQGKLDREICQQAYIYTKQASSLLNSAATNYKYSKLPGEIHHRQSYSPPKVETNYYSNKLDDSIKIGTISDNG